MFLIGQSLPYPLVLTVTLGLILKHCGAWSSMLTGGANGQPVGQYISIGTRIAETMTT